MHPLGTDIRFFVRFTLNGQGLNGVSVALEDIIKPDGTKVPSLVIDQDVTAFTEIGYGFYTFLLLADHVDIPGSYIAVVSVSQPADINPVVKEVIAGTVSADVQAVAGDTTKATYLWAAIQANTIAADVQSIRNDGDTALQWYYSLIGLIEATSSLASSSTVTVGTILPYPVLGSMICVWDPDNLVITQPRVITQVEDLGSNTWRFTVAPQWEQIPAAAAKIRIYPAVLPAMNSSLQVQADAVAIREEMDANSTQLAKLNSSLDANLMSVQGDTSIVDTLTLMVAGGEAPAPELYAHLSGKVRGASLGLLIAGGGSPFNGDGVRAEGLTSVAASTTAIKAQTDQMQFTSGDIKATLDGEVVAIDPESIPMDLDAVVEGDYTLRDLVRLISSHLFGKASGGGTSVLHFRDLGDTKDRLTITVGRKGDRTAVVLDPS